MQKNLEKFVENADLIFWDFDGVIKDSIEAKSLAFEELFDDFNDDFKKRVRSHHEKNTGVSTFFINENIDTGDIIDQRSIKIDILDSFGDLYHKLKKVGADLVLDSVNNIIENKINLKPQINTSNLNSANKLNKENCKIEWTMKASKVYNMIRGLSPYPGAHCFLVHKKETLKIIIYSSKIEIETHQLNNGQIIIEKKQIKIATTDGFIIPQEIKVQGKKRMSVSDLMNGFKFDLDSKFI